MDTFLTKVKSMRLTKNGWDPVSLWPPGQGGRKGLSLLRSTASVSSVAVLCPSSPRFLAGLLLSGERPFS